MRPSEVVRVLPGVFCGLLGPVSFLRALVSYAFLEGVLASLVEEVLSFLLEGGLVEGVRATMAEEEVRRPAFGEEEGVLTSRP